MDDAPMRRIRDAIEMAALLEANTFKAINYTIRNICSELTPALITYIFVTVDILSAAIIIILDIIVNMIPMISMTYGQSEDALPTQKTWVRKLQRPNTVS